MHRKRQECTPTACKDKRARKVSCSKNIKSTNVCRAGCRQADTSRVLGYPVCFFLFRLFGSNGVTIFALNVHQNNTDVLTFTNDVIAQSKAMSFTLTGANNDLFSK